MSVCLCVLLHLHVDRWGYDKDREVCGALRTTSGAGLHLPPYLRPCLMVYCWVHHLAVSWESFSWLCPSFPNRNTLGYSAVLNSGYWSSTASTSFPGPYPQPDTNISLLLFLCWDESLLWFPGCSHTPEFKPPSSLNLLQTHSYVWLQMYF